jgi:xanthine dehydrogenase accessory factor
MKKLLLESEAEVEQALAGKEDTFDHFLEYFYPKERLIILGGGHIAVPLVQIGKMIGFQVVVADDRPSFANKARFPQADVVLCESFERVFDQIQPRANDYIVIVTRGHRHDGNCIRQIFKYPESVYIGMIGSKRRVTDLKALLAEEGLDSLRLDKICTPIGLPIGAVTPEEISVSILAEVINRKRSKTENPFHKEEVEFDQNVWEYLAKDTKETFCIATILDAKGSTPREKGAKMIIFYDGRTLGSIGGGCSEADVIRRALQMAGSGTYEIISVDMTAKVAESEGMVCGGVMKVLLEAL